MSVLVFLQSMFPSKMMRKWIAVAIALALVLCVVGEEDGNGLNLKDGDRLSETQYGNLPDTSDPATAKRLKCSVCQTSVLEMLHQILGMETQENRKLKEYEIVEILERVCNKDMDEYGLILDKAGNPTHEWSNDAKIMKAKGGWVTRMAKGQCNDVFNEFEEYLVENGPKTCKVDVAEGTRTCNTLPLIKHICSEGLKICPKSVFPEDEPLQLWRPPAEL